MFATRRTSGTLARGIVASAIGSSRVLALVTGALLALGAGCSGTTKGATKMSKATAGATGDSGPSRCDAKGKRVVKVDLNEDKQPDVWKLFAKRVIDRAEVDVLACKERDLNFDGRKDIWYHYDDDGNLNLEEMDLDFDGKVDLVTIRRAGKVVRQEMDSNHDGRVDVWQHYEEEVLVRIERDTNSDGRVDYWEHYEGGRIDRIGYDKNGDGRVDRWDRAPSAPESATGGNAS